MKIDWGMVIIGLISILICIVPFVVIYYGRFKREKQMMKPLVEISKQHNCSISQHEFCGDFVIGIDETKNFIFLAKQNNDKLITQFVDLSNIQSCQVLKKSRNIKNDSGNFPLTISLELGFISKNKSEIGTRFELYNDETNVQLSGELQLVDKWSSLINNRINNRI